MPLISFTTADALKSAIMPAGAYRGMFTEINAPKTSKSGKTENYWSTLVITDGKYKDKEIAVSFNTGMDNPSALGTTAYVPFHYMLRLYQSVTGSLVDPENLPDIDTDDLVNQEVDVRLEQSTDDEGILGNSITDFFPAGSITKRDSL